MSGPVKNDPQAIRGWVIYDWANSAYATTILAAVLPAYFASVVVGDDGVEFLGRNWAGASLWALAVGLGPLLMFLATPILGAIADFSGAKKRFLIFFAIWGSSFAALLFTVTEGRIALALILFLLADIGFVGANVFYDAFLPDLTTDDTIDMVSSRGFAWGYIGGGIHLLLALALIQLADGGVIPLDPVLATRIALGSVGLWWLGFAIPSFRRIPETGVSGIPGATRPGWLDYLAIGVRRTVETTVKVARNRPLRTFALAFILFNDGVQTTIALASVYATDTLELDVTVVIVAVLLVQFIAFFGAMAFGRFAGRSGTRTALLTSIAIWGVVVVAAFFLPAGQMIPFLALAALIGFVLGGTQALSRSLYGSMIPEEASAEFYGFFSVFSKFSAFWGPWLFAVVRQTTGSSRWAILSIAGSFIVGGLLFTRVDIDRARLDRDSLRATAGVA